MPFGTAQFGVYNLLAGTWEWRGLGELYWFAACRSEHIMIKINLLSSVLRFVISSY